ncbi:MAG: JAB domain-containing protein [Leeuwenhoekiella sp.]
MNIKKNEFNEITAVYKRNPNVPQGKITGSASASMIARKIWPVDIAHREAIVCLMLDNSNNPTGFSTISTGGITSALCDLRVLYQNVLISNSVAIILVHNHPSGTLKPSQPDKDLTIKVKAAGQLLDIKLLDHIILTESSFYSFADEGLL